MKEQERKARSLTVDDTNVNRKTEKMEERRKTKESIRFRNKQTKNNENRRGEKYTMTGVSNKIKGQKHVEKKNMTKMNHFVREKEEKVEVYG